MPIHFDFFGYQWRYAKRGHGGELPLFLDTHLVPKIIQRVKRPDTSYRGKINNRRFLAEYTSPLES